MRQHLDGYDISWYGPHRHESHKKVDGLKVLSTYISDALRKAKVVTNPVAHKAMVQFRDDCTAFELFQRHPKTVWLNLVRDYRQLEALPLDASNAEIGEFSISIARDLQERVRSHKLVRGFPFEALEQGIERFRSENYSYTSKLSPHKKFDASPLTARFQLNGNCLKTTMTMIFYLKRKELHRRLVATFPPGSTIARYTSAFDLYDNEIKLLSMDPLGASPVIKYADLPQEVRVHLPSNEQLHKEWGTPYNPK